MDSPIHVFLYGGSDASFFHVTHRMQNQILQGMKTLKDDAHFKPFDDQKFFPMGSAMWS